MEENMSSDIISTAYRFATSVGSSLFRASGRGGTRRYLPEPKSSHDQTFGQVMRAIGNGLDGGVRSLGLGIDTQFLGLLQQQLHAQQQMQSVSMSSNIEKSKHETNMSPIRNIRVQ